MAWVVARDTQNMVVRDSYNYGPMADPCRDVFGCEAEAASLARYHQELLARGFGLRAANAIVAKVAVQAPVTARDARLIGVLFRRYGIIPAPFQTQGEYIDTSESGHGVAVTEQTPPSERRTAGSR